MGVVSKDRQKPLQQRSPAELRELAEARFKAREYQTPDTPALREYREAEHALISRMGQLRAERLAREKSFQTSTPAGDR